jgi:HK97 family phage prohead protease
MKQFTARMLSCKRSEVATRFGGSFRHEAARSKGRKDDRVVIGFASVFGNIDAAKDIVDEHAFDFAILDFMMGRSRARFLWNHDSKQPPIGKILAMKSLSRSELPRELIAADPNITGALQITKQYFTDSFADRVYQGVISGVITEMSFAYHIKRRREEVRDGKTVQILEQLDLMDVSDVNWGCNDRTIARVTSPKQRPAARSRVRPAPSRLVVSDAKTRILELSAGYAPEVFNQVIGGIELDLIDLRLRQVRRSLRAAVPL